MRRKRKTPEDAMTISGKREQQTPETGPPKRQSFEDFVGLPDTTVTVQAQPQQSQVLPFMPPGEAEEETEAGTQAYGRYRAPAGGYGVELFLPDGSVHALPYTQIVMITTNEKAEILTIPCHSGALFSITGQNLAPVRTALLRRRAAFLRAPAQGPENVSIQNICIEYPSREG